MENQHRKIKGYRDLSQQEIDLINRIKSKGFELLSLQDELSSMLSADEDSKRESAINSLGDSDLNELTGGSVECAEFRRFTLSEPFKWVDIGKTNIQTGIMALVRSIAQPEN